MSSLDIDENKPAAENFKDFEQRLADALQITVLQLRGCDVTAGDIYHEVPVGKRTRYLELRHAKRMHSAALRTLWYEQTQNQLGPIQPPYASN